MNGQEYEKVVLALGNFDSRMRWLRDKSRLSRLGSIVDISKHRWRPLFQVLGVRTVIPFCSNNNEAVDRVQPHVELRHLTVMKGVRTLLGLVCFCDPSSAWC